MRLGNLVSRIAARPIKGAVEREVKKAAGAEIRKMVADYLGSEEFKTGLTGSISKHLDEAVDRLLTTETLGMEAQQAILSAIQARHPTYEPVFVLSKGDIWAYSDVGTPIATVNGYARSRNIWDARYQAMFGIKTEARSTGGKLVLLTEELTDESIISGWTCRLTGELYLSIPQKKNGRTPSSA